jgi:hypothetical protein
MEVSMSLFQWLARGALLLGAITSLRGDRAGVPGRFAPQAVALAAVTLESTRIPMLSTIYRVTLLAGVIAAVTPNAANAQLGRLVKKAKAAAGIDTPAATAAEARQGDDATQGISVRAGDRITEPALEQFVIALEAERTFLAKQVAERKAAKTPEQYGACYQGIILDNAEGRKLMDQFERESKDASDQVMLRAAEKLAAELKRLTLEVCGTDPSEMPPLTGPEAIAGREKHAAAVSGMERRKYALLKERIIPLCALDASAVSDGDLSIPGDGANFVYLASEVTLVRPRCGALMPSLQAIS